MKKKPFVLIQVTELSKHVTRVSARRAMDKVKLDKNGSLFVVDTTNQKAYVCLSTTVRSEKR